MDNRSTFRYRQDGAKEGRSGAAQPVSGFRCQAGYPAKGSANPPWRGNRDGGASGPQVSGSSCREKLLSDEVVAPVPHTDTGRQVEHTQVNGRTLVKELGKIAP
jgi:hypothetical protein